MGTFWYQDEQVLCVSTWKLDWLQRCLERTQWWARCLPKPPQSLHQTSPGGSQAWLPSSKVRPTFCRDHHCLRRALWSILTKPGVYISWTDWLTTCNFLEGDPCCSTGEGRKYQWEHWPVPGSSFPNKATKLLHTQTFPRHGWLLLEHWRNSSVSQESEEKEHYSSEKNPHASGGMWSNFLQEAQAKFTIKKTFQSASWFGGAFLQSKVFQITTIWQFKTASQKPAFNIICCWFILLFLLPPQI